MAWHIVQKLLEQSAEHSTLIGKFWVTSFFIVRLLIVAALAGNVWGDAQGNFVCNTLSPGCKNVCFNEFSPIAVTRYWLLQILCVSLPSIMFIVYTAHKMAKVRQVVDARKRRMKEEKEHLKKIKEFQKEREKEREAGALLEEVEDKNEDPDDDDVQPGGEEIVATKLSHDAPSKLFLAYFFVVFLRLAIEIGFMVGQYYLYTFKFTMPELFQCQHWPCPNVVDCFVSRPKEKTVFICLFYATGCIMILLNLLELYHIAENFPKAWKERDDDITKHADEGPNFAHLSPERWAPGVDYIESAPDGYPDAVGMPMLYEVPPGYHRRRRRQRRARY